MVSTAPQIHKMSVNETRSVAVSMAAKLDDGETLTGTPTAVEVDSTELTLLSKTGI